MGKYGVNTLSYQWYLYKNPLVYLEDQGFYVFALNFRAFLPLPFANLIENFLGIGLTAWHEIVKLKLQLYFPFFYT